MLRDVSRLALVEGICCCCCLNLCCWFGTKQLHSPELADPEAAHFSWTKQEAPRYLPPSLLGSGDGHITNCGLQVTISNESTAACVPLLATSVHTHKQTHSSVACPLSSKWTSQITCVFSIDGEFYQLPQCLWSSAEYFSGFLLRFFNPWRTFTHPFWS